MSFELSEYEFSELCEKAKHWALVNGFIIMSKEQQHLASHLPFTLFPSPFLREHYEQAFNLQTNVNLLMHKIGTTHNILKKIFINIKNIDEFIYKLWNVYEKSHKDGYNQQISLIVIRTDYMMDKSHSTTTTTTTTTNGTETSSSSLPSSSSSSPSSSSSSPPTPPPPQPSQPTSITNGYKNGHTKQQQINNNELNSVDYSNAKLKQVEINTMSAGFGFVSGCMAKLHRQIMKWAKFNKTLHKMPENNPLEMISKAFIKAWELYKKQNSIILFIILDDERNIADQRHLEYEILRQGEQYDIEIVRCTLNDVYYNSHFDEDKTLYCNNQEVAIVYFRAGYSPSHYETHREWDALYQIERSKAIKCPSIGVFLAGMKIVQEYICDVDNLNEITDYDDQLNNDLLEVFGKFYKLNSDKTIQDALNNPHKYVLKPQREGGSNNYYGREIIDVLLNISNNGDNYERERYVLMEKYNPVEHYNYIIRSTNNSLRQEFNKTRITNELGIFGVIVRDNTKTYMNETCGYCLRSKPYDQNECGVMSGCGAVDSIYFYD